MSGSVNVDQTSGYRGKERGAKHSGNGGRFRRENFLDMLTSALIMWEAGYIYV